MGIKIIFVFLEFLFQAFNFSYELAFYLGLVLALELMAPHCLNK